MPTLHTLAIASLLAAAAPPALADPGDKGSRMRGGEPRAESADVTAPPPPRPAPRTDAPRPSSQPSRATSGGGEGEVRRQQPRSDFESRRGDGGSGWSPRMGTPRFDGGPTSPGADPSIAPPPSGAPGAPSETRRRWDESRSDRDGGARNGGRGNGAREEDRDDRSDWNRENRGEWNRDRRGDDARNGRSGRNSYDRYGWNRDGRSDPRYRWHWRHDPRWRFDQRWGWYDPLWRFHQSWGWYDPRWGWNPRYGYDPGWGWGVGFGFGFDWRYGVRAETAIIQDPLLRRWALNQFDRDRDGRLDPFELEYAAAVLEDFADLNRNRRLDGREIAFARGNISRFSLGVSGWDDGFRGPWR